MTSERPAMRDGIDSRAAEFLPSRLRPRLFNPEPKPHWIGLTDSFWYRREQPGGYEFRLCDAVTGAQRPAFDHPALAAALGAALGRAIDARNLPIEPIDLDVARATLHFLAEGSHWHYDGSSLARGERAATSDEAPSPDGRWAAFCREHDLWLRDRRSGDERRLTVDGCRHYAYAKSADGNLTTITLARHGIGLAPCVLWSPDAQRLFTFRLDERRVADLPFVQHVPGGGTVRPRLHQLKVALAGDEELALAELLVIDLASGRIVKASCPPLVTGVMSVIERQQAWWSGDGTRLWFVSGDRRSSRMTLHELDAISGRVRDILSESAASFVDLNHAVTGLPNLRIIEATGEFLWFSQRDGWGHLYLCDLATGAVKNRLTTGAFLVRDIVGVDEAARRVLFLAGGLDPAADPYHRTLCAANLDGTGMAVLTPEPGDHNVAIGRLEPPRDKVRPRGDPLSRGLSPSGRFIIETCAAIDAMPVTRIRRTADGGIVATLAETSLDPALACNWRWPLPFRVIAADGETPLYGALWLPRDFDPRRRYPVLDWIYPGPQRTQVPKVALAGSLAELGSYAMAQAFAELGCAVVMVDGRGTPMRSKAFHDYGFARVDDPGCLADHVATLGQLAQRFPYLDLGRVGIMGHSGGGHASICAMAAYPQLFRVAVAIAGNYDQRGYSFAWCEKYQGPLRRDDSGGTSYDAVADTRHELVRRIEGKLLLAYGEMDDNVHPALSLQLVAALAACDKDFDLVVLPNEDHGSIVGNPYFIRRWMDFIRRHLIEDAPR